MSQVPPVLSAGAAAPPARPPRPSYEALRAFVRNPGALIGLLLLAAILAVALFGPLVMQADPFEIASAPMEPPGGELLLGSDYLGRDVLTGMIYGGRATLLVGVVAAVSLGAELGPHRPGVVAGHQPVDVVALALGQR